MPFSAEVNKTIAKKHNLILCLQMLYFKISFRKMFIIADLVTLNFGVVVFDRFRISKCKILGLFKFSSFSSNLMCVKILGIIHCSKVKTLHLIFLPMILQNDASQ